MTPAEELRAATASLRGGHVVFDPEFDGPIAELLEHLGDDAEDYDASEQYAGTELNGPDRRRVVVDERGQIRHDLTAALALARVINGSGS